MCLEFMVLKFLYCCFCCTCCEETKSKTRAKNKIKMKRKETQHQSPPLKLTPQVATTVTVHDKKGKSIVLSTRRSMKNYRETFHLFDRNGDGVISKQELAGAIRSLGQLTKDAEVQDILQRVDCDGDDSINFKEFVKIMSKSFKEEEEKELRVAFELFDKHKRGYINASDLRFVLQNLDFTEDEIETVARNINTDGNGHIDFAEFKRVITDSEDHLKDEKGSTLTEILIARY